MLIKAGFEELVDGFAAEDILNLEEAATLSLDELRQVFNASGMTPSLGRVRRCHNALIRCHEPGTHYDIYDLRYLRFTTFTIFTISMYKYV